jgi:glycolate oxidase FAD binding subunit
LAAAALDDHIRGIVGDAHVQPTDPDDAVAGVLPQRVIEPGTEQELAAVLRCANDRGLAVIPRGGGTKLGWGNPPSRVDLVLSTTRLNRLIQHAWADLTVTVQAGCTVALLQAALAQHGQRLAVDALWPERATIGGILATNDSGALRLRFGALRDLVIGATVALPDGTLAASGGRVVKNVAGYDLPKLMTGALGTLGVITQATFRLHPQPHATRTLTLRTENIDAMQELLLAVQDSTLGHSALQIRMAGDAAQAADVLLEGTEAGLTAQEARIRGMVTVSEGHAEAWSAGQGLWSEPGGAIAKLAILPAEVAKIATTIRGIAGSSGASWRAVIQATGIGWLRLDGAESALPTVLAELRGAVEAGGGSLVVLRQPPRPERIEAWGDPGDALPLMRAMKLQLDPKGTLSPGRFVGGI